MKVLLLHNRYLEAGGEDAVVQAEAHLLRSHGVEVQQAVFENQSIGNDGPRGLVRLASDCVWSRRSYRQVINLCNQFRPDVMHVHNFWMRLSPSAHAAGHAAGVPTVQTLHNFRLLCANALLYRNGSPCEDCVGKALWRGVARRCYRRSAAASAAVATMTMVNRKRGTWEHEVDALIVLSEHSLQKFTAGGLPRERMFVKPNFVWDPGPGGAASSSKTLLFAGRLSAEKGLTTLLGAWARSGLGGSGRLLLAGDGPERATLERTAVDLGISDSVEFAGYCGPSTLSALLRNCRALVVPSLCYENFPRIVVEAFAHGRPVIGSDIGAVGEIITAEAGLRFRAGDDIALAATLTLIFTDGRLVDRLGAGARGEYLTRYTPEANFHQLLRIYNFARDRRLGVETSFPGACEVETAAAVENK